jgi:hypothetical protein
MTRRNGARAATIIPIGARRQGDQLATIFAARHEFAVGTFGTCRSFRRDGDIRLNFTHRAFAGSRACELTEINYGLSVSMRSCCAVNPEGDSDAYSGLGDFGDRDGLNRAGGGPDVRSGLPGLSAQVRTRGVNYYDCSCTSLPQCNASASGRSAQCVINPYFAGAEEPQERHYRRHPRVY